MFIFSVSIDIYHYRIHELWEIDIQQFQGNRIFCISDQAYKESIISINFIFSVNLLIWTNMVRKKNK